MTLWMKSNIVHVESDPTIPIVLVIPSREVSANTSSHQTIIIVRIASQLSNSPAEIMPSMSNLPPNVQSLIARARDLFKKTFDDDKDDLPYHVSTAPGRVNLIGEHTDYTGGYVLPLAIGYGTVCYGRGGIRARSTGTGCRVVSIAGGDSTVVEFQVDPASVPTSTAENKWVNYVQGVFLQYLTDLPSDETFVVDVAIAGDVPLGSGLSSSASLEVATAVFLESVMASRGIAYSSYHGGSDRGHFGTTMSAMEVAKERAIRCQRAENVFCGVPCGIMDQFVSSAGSRGNLLLIDCRSLDFRMVSPSYADGDDMPVLVIANSNVKHDLGAGEYPIRVRQCNDATEALSTVNSLIKSLRDASMDDIDAASASGALAGVLLRRARHVISENARTLNAADAWVSGDWESVGKLMNESHSSMKDDFEVSCDEIDILVQLAQNFHGVYGSRLTGGGFGGCTVTLVKRNAAQGLIDCLNKEYEVKTGTKCDCFVTSPADGAMAINV